MTSDEAKAAVAVAADESLRIKPDGTAAAAATTSTHLFPDEVPVYTPSLARHGLVDLASMPTGSPSFRNEVLWHCTVKYLETGTAAEYRCDRLFSFPIIYPSASVTID